jgi:hypothetical protein
MKYDLLVERFLKEAIGDNLGKLASIGANAVQNQQGKTVFDTLAKPGVEKVNCINTNRDKDWESRLGVGKIIYVRFADPATAKNQNKNKNQPPQPFVIPQNPPMNAKIDTQSGPHIWNGKEWINQNTNKPNPASGAITASWRNKLSQQASQQALNPESLPQIKVQLKIKQILDNGRFYAVIQDREKFYSRVIQSPTTGQAYSKIDIIKSQIDKNNENNFRVLMGKGTMEPNFCFV